MPCSSCNQNESSLSGHDGESRHARRGVMRLALSLPAPDVVAKHMGLPGADEADEELIRSIKGALALTEPLLQPVAIWALTELVDRAADSIVLAYRSGGADSISCRIPCSPKFFQGATHVHLSLITLGPRLEELLNKLFDTDPLTAMACDAVGSATLAAAGAALWRRRRKALAKEQLRMPIVYVPGCQALPLRAQQGIFTLLQPSRIGVQLSEACLMRPAKSATSVAPVGSELPAWMEKVSACQLCSLRKTCRFKATKEFQ